MASARLWALLLFGFLAIAVGQHPSYPPTWKMSESTIIMPCNMSGFTDPSSTKGWALIDFDWSNAKQIWAKAKPMDCAELLLKQVDMTTAVSPGTTVYVYRNSIKALPWYTTVRKTLEDPAYSSWFLPFKCTTNCHVPKCDNNYRPPLCSNYYHDQSQTPGYPSGDGNCASPACDVGSIPVGEYIWDPRAWNVSVNGKTLGNWFINDYIFDPTGGANPKVSGFFFDDYWDKNSGPSEYEAHCVEDMGLSKQELVDIAAAYDSNMKEVFAAVLARGKFSWQQLWTGQGEGGIASTCPGPRVKKATCAEDIKSLCSSSSPSQSRFMMYAFTPGECRMDPSSLPEFEADLTNFLLTRGKYAVLGHGWLGCSHRYLYPDALKKDYGEPVDTLCQEVSSGVFRRRWSKATVEMDCNTWKPSITLEEN